MLQAPLEEGGPRIREKRALYESVISSPAAYEQWSLVMDWLDARFFTGAASQLEDPVDDRAAPAAPVVPEIPQIVADPALVERQRGIKRQAWETFEPSIDVWRAHLADLGCDEPSRQSLFRLAQLRTSACGR